MTTRRKPTRSPHLALAGFAACVWLALGASLAVADDAKSAGTTSAAQTASDSAAAAQATGAPSAIKGVTPSKTAAPVVAKPAAPAVSDAATPATPAASSTAKPATPAASSTAKAAAPATPNTLKVAAPATPNTSKVAAAATPASTAPAKTAAPASPSPTATKTAASASISAGKTTTASPAPVSAVTKGTAAKAAEPAAQEERITYHYNALGRRDPFKALIDGPFVGVDEGANAPPDVGGIKVVGIVWGADDKFAMVEDPRGNSMVLRRGDKVMNGVVEGLKRDAVIVKLTNDGQEQSVVIPLTRRNGDQP